MSAGGLRDAAWLNTPAKIPLTQLLRGDIICVLFLEKEVDKVINIVKTHVCTMHQYARELRRVSAAPLRVILPIKHFDILSACQR